MSSTKNNVSKEHFPLKIDEFDPKRYFFFNRDEEEMIDQPPRVFQVDDR